MISPELAFEGFDSRSWTNLISLFSPGIVDRIGEEPAETDVPEIEHHEAPDDPVAGSVFIITNADGRVLKALHSSRGRIRDLEYSGPSDLVRIAHEYSSRRAIALREGVIEEITDLLAQRIERGDDYITQWIVLMQLFRDAIDAGKIHLSHDAMAGVPFPTPGVVRRAIELILPDDHCILLALWNGPSLWTAVAIRRRRGAIDFIAGPDLISRWTGPLGGDWRRDYRFVSAEVARSFAPVQLGLFAEVKTIRELLRSGEPGVWAKAAAVRDLVIHPTPPYVAVALGADAFRAIATQSTRLLGGVEALGILGPVAAYLRNRVGDVASMTALLGFDPLRALAKSLQRHPTDR